MHQRQLGHPNLSGAPIQWRTDSPAQWNQAGEQGAEALRWEGDTERMAKVDEVVLRVAFPGVGWWSVVPDCS
eukprot:3537357-Amphidinium_carterae.1